METGLILPVSNQLIVDLYSQPLAFVCEKIEEAVQESCPNLNNDAVFKKVVLTELVHYLISGTKLFAAQNIPAVEGHEDKLLKVRVLAGLAWKVMTHEHKALGGS